jgi:hypothetical protein
MEASMPRNALVALLLATFQATTHAAPSGEPEPISIAGGAGLRIDAAVRTGRGVAVRLRSDADLSAGFTRAALIARGRDGKSIELARAPLEKRWLDRSPRRRSRSATVEFPLVDPPPAGAEVVLVAGR